MKVKIKLPLIIVLLSVVPILIVSVVSYFFVLSLSTLDYKRLIDNQSNASTKHLDDFYSYQIDTIKYASKLEVYQNILTTHETAPEYSEYFKNANQLQAAAMKTNRYIDESFLISKSGVVVSSSNESELFKKNFQEADFLAAMESEDVVTSINTDETGKRRLLLFMAIKKDNGEKIGVLMRKINLGYISQYIRGLKIGESGYLYVIDNKGKILSHYYKERLNLTLLPGGEVGNLLKLLDNIANKTLTEKRGFIEYKLSSSAVLSHYQYSDVTGWTVVAVIPYSEIYDNAGRINIIIVAFAIGVLVLSLLIGIMLIRSITNPLSYISGKIRSIAAGNLEEVCVYNGKDEFKELSDNVNIMTKNLFETHAKLFKSALTDALTGMANRKAIYDIMDKFFDNTKPQAAMLIDLDGFKNINDTLGHDYGDDVLRSVAKVFERFADENIFSCRLGGDEFFVFIKHYSCKEEVMNIAQGILNEINAIKTAMGAPINISASIGISFVDMKDKSRERLMKKADVAMYKIKASGKSRCLAFDDSAQFSSEL